MHSQARYYDLLAWLLTLGREGALRERLVSLAGLSPGDTVLDVGCGTGTLAIAVKRRVGAAGSVHGIDASPAMIARARRKAAKAGAEVAFRTAIAEELPFPDASVDVVLSTLMMHHLPRPARMRCVREMRRVLRPGGRVLAVDFAPPAGRRAGILGRFHRHGHTALREIVELLTNAGLRVVEFGSVGLGDLQFALAAPPDGNPSAGPARRMDVYVSLEPLPRPRWPLAVATIALAAGHGLVFRAVSPRLAISTLAAVALAGLLVVTHSGFAGLLHRMRRRRVETRVVNGPREPRKRL
jgi:ubiquinone/menaquinone biosynthesis C-methylase UbiE